jgi:hypothetical protein
VLRQTGSSVTFQLNYQAEVCTSFIQYHDTTGETGCFSESCEDISGQKFTAYCMSHVEISVVDIWITSSEFNETTDNAEVPECCHDGSYETKTVLWSFMLNCTSSCPTDERALLAADSIEEYSISDFTAITAEAVPSKPVATEMQDGHFCSSTDYPCGDNDELVHVCHYSARNGYQTFCVPEKDSDALVFYPKDYCGPCIGGFKESPVRELF